MKVGREKFKVWGDVFDGFTHSILIKMISQHYFDGLESPFSIGKEANVFTALTEKGRVVVKIYRLETCDFNKMYDYIKADPRYANLKGKKRKIIFNWVEREYRNIMKARETGVRVPMPITFMNNVLVLEFIGDIEIAPRVKDLIPKLPDDFFMQVIEGMKKIYRGGLVHADLSGFNILNYNENPVFIDFSQATTLNNPRSMEFLERDIKNVCTFFSKIGAKTDEKLCMKYILGESKHLK